MKHSIRSTLLVVGLLVALMIVQGCQIGVPIDDVVVLPLAGYLSPSSGHPDFDTTVIMKETGGTFLYEVTGHDAVTSNENTFDTTVDAWPWSCKITWQLGDDIKTLTLTPTLVNSPPVIRKPRINGAFGLWKAWPYEQTTVLLNYSNDAQGHETGISDPDGDSWTITAFKIVCDSNDGEADTLFYPSRYGVLQYHVDSQEGCRAEDVYPAAVWYPTYIAELGENGLPESITPLPWYELLASFVTQTLRWQYATMTVTAEDALGASSTKEFSIPIDAVIGTVINEPNLPPVAVIAYEQSGSYVAFDGRGSSDTDGSIKHYRWTFGDGEKTSNKKPSHTYATPGTYTTTLTVTDNEEATNSVIETIIVEPPFVANVLPVAKFASPVVSEIDTGRWRVYVDASNSTDGDGDIVTYTWSFEGSKSDMGSGVSSSAKYITAGRYKITLTVTDDRGGLGTCTKKVTVPAAS